MARKKKEKKKAIEGEELQEGKKKGKKKLLLIPVALIVIAAVAAAAVLVVLPKFGINLLPSSEPGPGEEEAPKSLETFIAGEPITNEDGEEIQDATISLDTLLEEGEGTLIAVRKPGEIKKGEPAASSSSSASSSAAEPEVEQYTYIYDVAAPAAIVDRYLDAVLGGEEKFVLVDDTYLHLEERPVLEDTVGTVTIARKSVQDGRLFQIVIGWSEASSLVFRTSAPEGSIHEPEKEPGVGLGSQVVETVPLTTQIETIRSMSPAQFGLEGDSMDGYEIYPVEGFVKVDGLDCRRFNIYVSRGPDGDHYPDLEAIVLLSSDQKHVYRLDPESNAVTELR